MSNLFLFSLFQAFPSPSPYLSIPLSLVPLPPPP
ncbi:hypothetical protein SLEP1_g47950 [Rubroshorea leprosula]|uniref:Uncharacterized protein n=1 Tax=Rubroshorea leprosula TaxID=152421 RepID=A0AAV5LUX5_9ROSI|nr:hypothetical protein SLEP1_g47950 [Rubroshorea leprosula]